MQDIDKWKPRENIPRCHTCNLQLASGTSYGGVHFCYFCISPAKKIYFEAVGNGCNVNFKEYMEIIKMTDKLGEM